MPRSVLATFTLVVAWVAIAVAADLQNDTRLAYESYSAQATQMFLDQVRNGASDHARPASGAAALSDGEILAAPAREDGIISVPGGLVHHWAASTVLAGVTLQDAVNVASDYNGYQTIYKQVVKSKVLSHEGNTYRVRLRIKDAGGGLSATLDLTSRVQYFYPNSQMVYSISRSEDIREIENAGTSSERSLPAGHDSGYLWRAATLTSFSATDRGVAVHTEALGLSRGFPRFLGWVIEPVARRLGRKSVEQSLREFTQAVKARVHRAPVSNEG